MNSHKLDSKGRRKIKYCPCNKSNSDGKFVPYFGYENFGYCHSCSKYFPPENGTIIKVSPQIELPTFFLNMELVKKLSENYNENNLVKFLNKHFNTSEVEEVILKYLIGTYSPWKNSTIFWQIDNQNKVRNGKIMLYDCFSGRRSKKMFNTVQKAHRINLNGHKIRQCLFGLHLLRVRNDVKKVAIVESEKTAVIMSIIFKDYVWLATGGKGSFKYDMLKSVKHLDIIAFPDKDATEEWRQTANKLNMRGFNITNEETLSRMQVSANADIADVFLNLN